MANKKGGTTSEDLMRAAYDSIGDGCISHNVLIGYKVMPTERRGVFEIQIAAFRDIPNRGTVKVAKYSVEWPNSQNLDLAGAFFRAANQLDHILTSQGAAEAKGIPLE